MKVINIIITILFFTDVFGQELPQKDGCIEIKKVNHYFLRNKNGEQTKKITNKSNRPYLLLYFDTLGNLIEKVGYGKNHNTDLRILNFIEQNKFENGKLVSVVKYTTDYDKNINADYKTIYFYNNFNQLIKEKVVYFKTDSLLMEFDYEYDSNGNETKTIFNPKYYYQRVFDNQSRIQSLQQIYDNKLRWEWTYTYTDTTRIGEFKTFYNDGKDYTKKEVRTYRNGKLIEVEEKYTSQEGLSSKTVLHYDKFGLIVRIDYFKAFSNNRTYKLQAFTEVKTKFCKELTPEIIEKINDIIYDE